MLYQLWHIGPEPFALVGSIVWSKAVLLGLQSKETCNLDWLLRSAQCGLSVLLINKASIHQDGSSARTLQGCDDVVARFIVLHFDANEDGMSVIPNTTQCNASPFEFRQCTNATKYESAAWAPMNMEPT